MCLEVCICPDIFVWEMRSGGIKYYMNVFGGMHVFVSDLLDIDITGGVHLSGGMNIILYKCLQRCVYVWKVLLWRYAPEE
jgi:hypothetical protein